MQLEQQEQMISQLKDMIREQQESLTKKDKELKVSLLLL